MFAISTEVKMTIQVDTGRLNNIDDKDKTTDPGNMFNTRPIKKKEKTEEVTEEVD